MAYVSPKTVGGRKKEKQKIPFIADTEDGFRKRCGYEIEPLCLA